MPFLVQCASREALVGKGDSAGGDIGKAEGGEERTFAQILRRNDNAGGNGIRVEPATGYSCRQRTDEIVGRKWKNVE
jgi:hypothetical protein